MKLTRITLLAALVLAVGAAQLRAEGQGNIDDLIQPLAGQRPMLQQTPQQLQVAYSIVIEALLPDMGSPEPARQKEPQQTIQKIAWRAGRPGAEAERSAFCTAAASKLGGGSAIAKMWLLKQLEFVGRGECVNAVAALLNDTDPHVRDCARRVLQNNPAPAAAVALRGALPIAHGEWRAALINALAYRKDPADTALFIKEAAASDEQVRCAAMLALADLGNKSAADAIVAAMTEGSPRAQAIAADTCVRLAETLSDKGQKPAAIAVYRKLLGAQNQLKCAAIVGLGKAGDLAELPLIFDALASADPKVRGAGVEALNLIPGTEVTAAIARKVDSAPAQMKVVLLRALAARNDKSTIKTFVAAVDAGDSTVAVEALRGLAVLGDASVVPTLLKAAAAAAAVQDAARAALDTLQGDGVDQAMILALANAEPKIAVEIARSLAARKASAAAPALLKSAQASDAAVRTQSFKALAAVGDSAALPSVVELMIRSTSDADRDDAAKAVVAIARRMPDTDARTAPVLAVLSQATGPTRAALLGVLGRIGGVKSLQSIRDAIKDHDEKVREAGLRALADWPDASVADDLLAIAKTSAGDVQHVIALRGYVRVVGLPGNRPAVDTVKMFNDALAAARRNEEKRLVLGGLGEVRDIAALRLVETCLSDAALKDEAAAAAVKIAREIWQGHAQAVKTTLEKVLAAGVNDAARRQAQDTLNRINRRR